MFRGCSPCLFLTTYRAMYCNLCLCMIWYQISFFFHTYNNNRRMLHCCTAWYPWITYLSFQTHSINKSLLWNTFPVMRMALSIYTDAWCYHILIIPCFGGDWIIVFLSMDRWKGPSITGLGNIFATRPLTALMVTSCLLHNEEENSLKFAWSYRDLFLTGVVENVVCAIFHFLSVLVC